MKIDLETNQDETVNKEDEVRLQDNGSDVILPTSLFRRQSTDETFRNITEIEMESSTQRNRGAILSCWWPMGRPARFFLSSMDGRRMLKFVYKHLKILRRLLE